MGIGADSVTVIFVTPSHYRFRAGTSAELHLRRHVGAVGNVSKLSGHDRPLLMSGSADVVTVDGQRHVDVAPGGVRVRTHMMCGSDDPRCLLGVLHLRQGHMELHGKLETTLLGGKKAHTTIDRSVARLDAFATTHHAECTLEAGGITHCEELFGVRATPSPPNSFGKRSWTSKAPSFVRPWPPARPPVTVASAV